MGGRRTAYSERMADKSGGTGGNWLQRGLASLSASIRAISSGEGESKAARLGRSVRQTAARFKSMLGIPVAGDGFEAAERHSRRKAAQKLIGAGEVAFVPQDGLKARDLNATVEKQYRGQVASGLAAASSRAVGSSLMDAPGWEDVPDGSA